MPGGGLGPMNAGPAGPMAPGIIMGLGAPAGPMPPMSMGGGSIMGALPMAWLMLMLSIIMAIMAF